jgi:small GTP-binding protein
VIGESGCGKTNLISRYTRDIFTTSSKPTIGVEFASKLIEYEGIMVRGQIWDTAGHERTYTINTI